MGNRIAQIKESGLRFIMFMKPEGQVSLFLFTDDVTEVELLSRDMERLEHREDHRRRG